MPAKKYRVRLSAEERWCPGDGRRHTSRPTPAFCCLSMKPKTGLKDEQIAKALKVGSATVERVRRPVLRGE